jgi:S1-C subfamily serine protease
VVGVTENDVHIDGHINQGGSGGPGADYDTAELIFLNMAIYSGDDVGGMGIGLPIYSVAPMIDGVIEEDLDRRENLTAQSILFQQTLPSDESEAPDCTARETKKYFRRKKSSAEELSSQVEFPEEISMSSRVSPY